MARTPRLAPPGAGLMPLRPRPGVRRGMAPVPNEAGVVPGRRGGAPVPGATAALGAVANPPGPLPPEREALTAVTSRLRGTG